MKDDCLAINKGTNIVFQGNSCTGGHGISIVRSLIGMDWKNKNILTNNCRDPLTPMSQSPASLFPEILLPTSECYHSYTHYTVSSICWIATKLFVSKPNHRLQGVPFQILPTRYVLREQALSFPKGSNRCTNREIPPQGYVNSAYLLTR